MTYPPDTLATNFDDDTPTSAMGHAGPHNDVNAAVNAVVGELGDNPSGADIETEAGGSYTVVAGDGGKVKRFTANATVSLPDGIDVGTVVELLAYHADGLTVEAGGTATVRNAGDVGQYGSVSCLVVVADEWVVTGATS